MACLQIALILLIVWALLFCNGKCEAKEPISFNWNATYEDYSRKIDSFLVEYFAKCHPKKLKKAREIAPIVLDISQEMNVNPSIIASIVTYESTWDYTAVGDLGEIGLMQVNRGNVGADPADQLRAGIFILREAYAKCGSVEGAISLYATGKSCKPYKGAKLRIRTAEKIEGY